MQTYCKSLLLAFGFCIGLINPIFQTATGQNLPEISFGGHTLQVNPTDHDAKLPWGPTHRPAGSMGQANGHENKHLIVSAFENWNHGNYAAKICANLDAYGYTDWYLPSASEFQAMYQNRQRINNFSNAFYWTSTEDRWGGDAQALNPESGQLVMQSKFDQNRVRCIRRAQKGEVGPEHTATNSTLDKERANVLVTSRYALKSDGTKGLLFGARFLSFFTIASTSFILETATTQIASSILKGTAKELVKDYAKSKLISSLPGMDKSNIRYISYAFPIKKDKQLQVEDVIILLEMADDRDLVPLNVPVQLHYKSGIKNPGEPTLAIKNRYDIQFDSQAGYKALSLSTLWNRFRPTNLSSSNFRFQTFGVVDGYYTTNISSDRKLTFMILKQYDNYDLAYMQTTDINFIAVDVTQLHQYPVPGSVIHLWGEPVGLGGLRTIDLRGYSSERTSVSRYVRMDGHKLLSGIYAPANQVEQGRSVFSVNSDPHHWDAVVVDLYHGEYSGWDEDQSEPYTELSEYLIGSWGFPEDDGSVGAVQFVFEEENMFSMVIEGKTIDPVINHGPNYRELIEDYGHHSSFLKRYNLDESKRPIRLDFILYGQKGDYVNELARIKSIMRVLDDGTIELRGLDADDHYDSFDSTCPGTIFMHRMEDIPKGSENQSAGGTSGQSGNFTDPRDGLTYKWVKIGDQVWMAENLQYKPQSGSYRPPDNNRNNVKIYGYLYDYHTAMQICPDGWQLPSDTDWNRLFNYVSSDPVIKLKAKHSWKDNKNGTDKYGFAALPAGFYSNRYNWFSFYAAWWSSTLAAKPYWYWVRSLHYTSERQYRYGSASSYFHSVRCIKTPK